MNTANPPGNETVGARFLAQVLDGDGVASETAEPALGRGNLVARLKSDGSLGGIVLHHRIDVVYADERYWTVDPFGGLLKDGFVYGRGAIDMNTARSEPGHGFMPWPDTAPHRLLRALTRLLDADRPPRVLPEIQVKGGRSDSGCHAEQPDGGHAMQARHVDDLAQQLALLGSGDVLVARPFHGGIRAQTGSSHVALLGSGVGNRDFYDLAFLR